MDIMSISVPYYHSEIDDFVIKWHSNRLNLLLLEMRLTAIFDNIGIIKY